MPSPAILEFDELLKPIPGADPAGANPSAARAVIDTARKLLANPQNPGAAAASSGKGPRTLEDIQKFAILTLSETTKDFEIASRLVVVLVERYAHRGLRDGLRLLRRLVEEAWDRTYPKREEPGDEVLVVSRLKWLGDAAAMTPFPHAVLSAKLFSDSDVSYGAWEFVRDPKTMEPDQYDAMKAGLKRGTENWKAEACQAAYEEIRESAAELKLLDAALREKLGLDERKQPVWSPSYLAELSAALEKCERVVEPIFREKCPGAAGKTDKSVEGPITAPESSSPAAVPAPGPRIAATGRKEILDQMRQLADDLKKIEPHSPIPHLVERAVRLGDMPFQAMVLELFGTSRSELEKALRELGIAPPEDGDSKN